MTNRVRESAKFIAENAEHVKIDNAAVIDLAKHLLQVSETKTYSLSSWKEHELFPSVADVSAVDWIFVVDVLNFNFWNDSDARKCVINYKDVGYTGYMALCAAINRALDNGIPITDPKYYATISEEDLAKVFKPDSGDSTPLMPQRLAALREAGTVLNEHFESSFTNCLRLADRSAQKLLKIIADHFGAFRDEAVYANRKVSFYKRAQILVADIWACFEGEGLGTFDDIDSITMFADYRIPQVLVHFGVLKYSEKLQQLLNESHVFTFGDALECEIRGCTIHAVDLLYQEMTKLSAHVALNVILIDHYLWDYRREHAVELRSIPYHKVRCIYY